MIQSQREVGRPAGSRSRRPCLPTAARWPTSRSGAGTFPIDWAQDEYVSRRELVKFIVLTSAALAVGQFWIVLKSAFSRSRRRSAGRADRRAWTSCPIGGAKTFTYPEGSTPRCSCGPARPRSSPTTSSARTCSARWCRLSKQGRLHCPCHNGWFDLETGRPSPARRSGPLPRICVEVRDGIVYATGVEESTT